MCVQFGPNTRHLWQPSDNCGVHASFVNNVYQGVPDDWDEYFAQRGAQQYVYSLDDVAPKTATLKTRQTKVFRRPGWECASNCGLCVAPGWNGGPWLCCFIVLGVGTAALAAACACLIIGHGFTAETAMCHVLGPKRSLRPWKNRLYVPLALLLLQQARNVVVDAFDTLLRDRAKSFQWVFHLLLRQIVKSMLFGRKCSITLTWKWPRRVQFGATEQTAMLPDVDVFLVKLYNILDTCYITCLPCYFAVYLTFHKIDLMSLETSHVGYIYVFSAFRPSSYIQLFRLSWTACARCGRSFDLKSV